MTKLFETAPGYVWPKILRLFLGRLLQKRGRNSAVGIATSFCLDGQGIESRWGERFSAPVLSGPETHSASYTNGTGSFPGVKRPGLDLGQQPPSSAEVKDRLELYLYLWNFVACFGVNFYFTFTFMCRDRVLLSVRPSASKHFVGFPRNPVHKFTFLYIHSVRSSTKNKIYFQ